MPARYALERGRLGRRRGAARSRSSQRPQADSLTRFTRGLGMARSGDLAGAKREIQAMQALRTALREVQPVVLGRPHRRADAGRVGLGRAQPRARASRPCKLMRAAADGEDGSVKHVAMENRLYPMRELLGELLLQMGQAAAALREFESLAQGDPQPLSRALRRRAGRGSRRRPPEGRRLFREARRAGEATPIPRGRRLARAKAFLGQR